MAPAAKPAESSKPAAATPPPPIQSLARRVLNFDRVDTGGAGDWATIEAKGASLRLSGLSTGCRPKADVSRFCRFAGVSMVGD
jgi:hypothetical protein